MPTLLINSPTGEQKLEVVGEGGGYFDPSKVIWNTAIDGDMPAITLGAMVRINNQLIPDNDRLAEHNAALAPGIPQKVLRRQAKQAMRINGLTPANVMAAINAIPDELTRDLAMIEYQDALEFFRDSPLVASLAPSLDLTPEQIDTMFVLAATL
jgi:hypothetical protein